MYLYKILEAIKVKPSVLNISGSHSHRQRTASERSTASQSEHKPTHYKAHAGKCCTGLSQE